MFDMIQFMFFFLLVFVSVETITKHVICDTPMVELFYIMCDDTSQLTISMDSCWFNPKGRVNISIIVIPRSNLDYVYSIAEIWNNGLKVSDGRKELCTGTDDEFDFCGAVKGETVTWQRRKNLYILPSIKGIFNGKLRVYAGQKEEELILCADFTLINK